MMARATFSFFPLLMLFLVLSQFAKVGKLPSTGDWCHYLMLLGLQHGWTFPTLLTSNRSVLHLSFYPLPPLLVLVLNPIQTLVVVVVAVAPNDKCVDAITLEVFQPVDGDTTDSNYDFVNQGVCGARSDRSSVWYEIIGKGKPVTVYVCTNNERLTDFGVFAVCNTQQCTGAPDQQTEPANCDDDDANIFTFDADLGEDYFVHVRADLEPDGSNFTIWYTEPSDAPTMVPSSACPFFQPTVWMATTLYSTVPALLVVMVMGWAMGGV
jgi:hypothetical protein